ncbi:polysaccharide deacetylase [Rhizobiales bacterium]|nr:polysaccharide deacetylase [Hongsoonwoonella zoysiae]
MIANPVPWPNNARCAVAITYDLDADSLIHIAKPDTADTYLSTQSLLRYGVEVALPRICRIYEHFNLRQTFFVPAWCIERYPSIAETIVRGGHEIGHHGYIHESYNQQSAADEAYWFERAVRAYEKHLGFRPRGFRAPLNEFSKHTLANLIDFGIEYDSSLMGEDVPYMLKSRERIGDVLEIPQFIANDDYPQFMHNWDFGIEMTVQSPQNAKNVYLAEFDAQYENGGMWLSVWHPFLSGRTSRAKMLIEILEYIMSKGDVWFATMGEINDHVRRCIADGVWTPREDILPYDTSPIIELSYANRTRADTGRQ